MTNIHTRTLGEICDEIGGTIRTGPFGSQLHMSDYLQEGTPVVMPKDISNGRISIEDIARIGHSDVSRLSQHKLMTGDIIYGRRGDIGRRALITDKENGWICGTGCLRISLGDTILDPTFLYYYLGQPAVIKSILNQAVGATMPNLNTTIIRNIPISYPHISIQQKIASILSTCDNLIENNSLRIKILEDMAQTIYNEWFVKFRFPGHENMKMVESELGIIPEGWEVKNLGEIALNFDRLRKPLSSMQRAERKGIYPYYGAAKVFDYIDDYIFDGIYLLLAEDGSVVTPDRRPVLQYVNGKFWANNHTHILQGKGCVTTEFLYLVLSEVDINGYITGAAQPKITQANLNRIPVVVPDDSILQDFNQYIVDIFRQQNVLHMKNTTLRTIRDLLLPRLISGEINVSELDIDVGGITV